MGGVEIKAGVLEWCQERSVVHYESKGKSAAFTGATLRLLMENAEVVHQIRWLSKRGKSQVEEKAKRQG